VENIAAPHVSENTIDGYRMAVYHHLRVPMGRRRLRGGRDPRPPRSTAPPICARLRQHLRPGQAGLLPAQGQGWEPGKSARMRKRYQHVVSRSAGHRNPPTFAAVCRSTGLVTDWQPVTTGSPGQRSAAMLSFVLHHGKEPLVLDQPEIRLRPWTEGPYRGQRSRDGVLPLCKREDQVRRTAPS
jgi:hypothetical protein